MGRAMTSILMNHVSKAFARKVGIGTTGSRPSLRPVLNDVNIEVGEGEIACLLGRNGSGKTTLTRIISTLIRPDRGQVNVCGFDTVSQPQEVRKRIGVMLNAGEGGFQPRLSGFSNLEYYASLYKVPIKKARARIARILSDLAMGDIGADQFQSYSSGMRKRLALARALLPDVPVLLLDEPTLGVDPWTTELIHDYLVEQSRNGKTIVCTTNTVSEARAIGTRVLVLENGVLLQHELARVPES